MIGSTVSFMAMCSRSISEDVLYVVLYIVGSIFVLWWMPSRSMLIDFQMFWNMIGSIFSVVAMHTLDIPTLIQQAIKVELPDVYRQTGSHLHLCQYLRVFWPVANIV